NAPLASYVVGRRPAPPPAPERYRQPWPITALVFSPEGSELIASGYHEITFWDPIRGSLQRRLGGMPERIRALAWQPGGNLIAVPGGEPGRSGAVLLADLSTNLPPAELAAARDELLCAAFSPNAERLAIGGADSIVRVFDIQSRRELL